MLDRALFGEEEGKSQEALTYRAKGLFKLWFSMPLTAYVV
jgi:hypothetical protein